MKRIGVDIGGTFTDLVLYDENQQLISSSKTLSTRDVPEQAVKKLLEDVGLQEGVSFQLMHGTTIVTNLIVERSGAKVGLITTRGFRDVLESMRADRQHLYDLQWDKPRPFVPRFLRVEVDERLDHRGNVLVPLQDEDVQRVVEYLLGHEVEAVAVCLLHSYTNPAHEQRILQIISEMAPQLPVTLSYDVNPEIREYERTSTAVLNSYALQKTRSYVNRLEDAFSRTGGIRYMHSGGGLVSSEIAASLPVYLAFSGPAAGVLAATWIAERTGISNIVTIDMGGTSFDVCLVQDGVPATTGELMVEWEIPIRTRAININSIGAGGGSIAWLDAGGALRVGPRSARADPGPACYNRGGTEPTVTDANMVLGLLNPANFVGSKLILDADKSTEALRSLAAHFDQSVAEVAKGIYSIVNANMAQAIREITIEKGIDPRDFTIVSFGGAGGQHAIEVAREVGSTRVIFPVLPGTFSALGLLAANMKYARSKSLVARLSELSMDRLSDELATLEREGRALLSSDREFTDAIVVEYSADLRYVQQSHEISVELDPDELTHDRIYTAFEDTHERLYGTRLGDPLEIINLHVTVVGRVQRPTLSEATLGSKALPEPVRRAEVAFFDQPIAVFAREDLRAGMSIADVCLIEEADSVLYIPDDCSGQVDRYGNIIVELTKQRLAIDRGEFGSVRTDPFTSEVIGTYLASTVREMVKTTTRTAYSIVFSEGLDFSCALFDGEARCISLESGNPVHMASLPSALQTLLERYPELDEGDILLTNDPYRGGTHHSDVVVVKPVFYEGRLVAFGINRGHWSDIGGMSAGGFSGAARDVIQEGLIIPPIKLYRRGELVPELKDLLMSNVRVSDRVWGDVQAQIAAVITAERRVHALIDKYGLAAVIDGMDYAIEYSNRRFLRGMEAIPDGEYQAVQFMEDDGAIDRPYRIEVRITKDSSRFTVDFTGSDRQALGPINASLAVSMASSYCALTAVVDAHAPLNQGVFDLIEVIAPEGTVVNPTYPAPLYGGNCDTAALIFETAMKAFADAMPDRVMAGHVASGMNTTAWGQDPETREEFAWYMFVGGGWGARMSKDGNNDVFHAMGNCMNQPVEVWETRHPTRIEKCELRTDSGGAGKYRGGLGIERHLRMLARETLVSALADGFTRQPYGLEGGRPGSYNAYELIRAGGEPRSLREVYGLPSWGKYSNVPLQQDDLFIIKCAGGGGFGPPEERDLEALEWDVLSGYVSRQAALEEYRVWIDEATGKVDREKTERLRSEASQQ